MKYRVIYDEDGRVMAASPADADLPLTSEGEQAAEVEVQEEQPDFDHLYFDVESRSLKPRSGKE